MNLLKKFFSFSIGSYISLIIGFFSLPITTRIISPKQYGIFSFFLLITNLGSLLMALGLDQGFVRYYFEEKNKSKLFYTCIKYPLLLYFFISICIYIYIDNISLFLYNEVNYFMVYLLVISLFILILKTFTFLLVRMNKKGFKYSLLQILEQSSNFALILLLYKYYKNSYKVLIIAYFLSTLLVTFLSIVFEFKTLKKNKKETINVNDLSLLKYSFPFILTFSLSWIFNSSDKIIIKYYSSLNELGLYAMSFTIIKLFNIVQTGFTLFWVPVAYEKYTHEPKNKIFFNQVFNNISIIMFLLAILVLMFKNIIVLFLGKNYYLSSSIIPCLVFMPVMYTISETTVLSINFRKKTEYHIIVSLIVAVFNIIGNLVLVPKLGAKGAAISTGIAYILFFFLRTYFAESLMRYEFKLKRCFIMIILIFFYSLYLSFYNYIIFNFIIGVLLLIFLYIFYFNEIRIIFLFVLNYKKDKIKNVR